MEDIFTLDISYKEQVLSFEVKLVAVGYTHKFHTTVNGVEIIYEPDEERSYRAIIRSPDGAILKEKDIGIIKSIAQKLEEIKR